MIIATDSDHDCDAHILTHNNMIKKLVFTFLIIIQTIIIIITLQVRLWAGKPCRQVALCRLGLSSGFASPNHHDGDESDDDNDDGDDDSSGNIDYIYVHDDYNHKWKLYWVCHLRSSSGFASPNHDDHYCDDNDNDQEMLMETALMMMVMSEMMMIMKIFMTKNMKIPFQGQRQ